MGKALYRQYRPTSFDEVIGQDHITTTLKNSLSSGSVGHAYLLTGPRGVGKTSVARALAFAVNDLPYQKDSTHLDIIEIDAASNRRIDEIRALRERVNIAPTSGKYKVYIIDEVHMLTREAFNALLKTLEEPPAHVIFILATTEIHKLPDTIVSRCITFTFRPIGHASIVGHLKYIAKAEGLKITTGALELLASHGDGSFRDSISLLDQVKDSKSELDVEDIELALGLASKEIVSGILKAVSKGDAKALDSALQSAYEHGASETNLGKQIAAEIRSGLITGKPYFSSENSLDMLAELLAVPSSPKPRAKLELCLLGQLFKSVPMDATPRGDAKVPTGLDIHNETKTVKPAKSASETDKPDVAAEPVPAQNTVQKATDPKEETEEELWSDTLLKLKKQNNTLYGIARMAQAEKINNKLTLCFKFPFHFRQVNQPKNKQVIASIIEKLGYKNIKLIITQADGTEVQNADKNNGDDKTLSSITNIFGDSEVLES